VARGNGLKSTAMLLVGGVIGVALAPTLLPALAKLARPATKAGIRTGLLLFERGRIAAAELWETLEDLTAEVQAEFDAERALHRQPAARPPASPEAASGPGPNVVH
jgi:hypothetical protein